jgi:hypothetical protein
MHSTRLRRRDELHQVELEVFLFHNHSSYISCALPRSTMAPSLVAGFVDILTDGHLHSVFAGSGGGGGDPVADAVLVVEAGLGRHLMSSLRHSPRWRASQCGRWRRQWWRGARGWGTALVALPETVCRSGRTGGGGAWSCMRRQQRARCGRCHSRGGPTRGAPESCAAAAWRGGARRLPGRGSPALAAAASPEARRRWRGGARWGESDGGAALRAGPGAAPGRCSAAAQGRREGGLVCRLRPTAALPPIPLPSPAEPPPAALPALLADPTPGPAAARCRSAGRPPAPAAADIRTVLWAVADTVRALAAGAAIGAKVLPAEGD